ncbi:Glucose/arabinose dehydrogenase, beta-propeller fold [Aliiroseovarius halocynthiae]|uniref:PQQ-dependent sugar dehydrogenase n=1 Tax=Aliiroseovarius halocynthiae TaxID=985055 RepID=A0A545SV39_9RHOB|nr:PQQ-dependent sugar dehydrogenase [Aliiroseovarius halocynthiae]TQV68830.1 PQQ-dependent sugar dehydrogenase [Aliiroseovarius halocynthiae]SMR71259.1 Glucose/arabinose dehydrogenase, beta-propeller fold [Aliiroseovarius halocynthiae]
MRRILTAFCLGLSAMAFTPATSWAFPIESNIGTQLDAEKVARFDHPWAMSFLNNEQALVTTKPGRLWLVSTDGTKTQIAGVPSVLDGGQGGLGDVVPNPKFAQNGWVYLSYVAKGDQSGTRQAVVIRAQLDLNDTPTLTDHEEIWRQFPAYPGRGHFSHRLAFGPAGGPHDGKLFITSGDRQELDPAQDMAQSLGKLIRLNEDGTVPTDNPFQDQGELAKSFWTLGHRNSLGIAFDTDGRLWAHEMGPRHGDELNLIVAGQNYGWPLVSNGDHYSGVEIPDHDTRPDLAAPRAYWVPSIAPSGLEIYTGNMFPDWHGSAVIGGLVSRALIRVRLHPDTAAERERFSWDVRIRDVEQGPDGALWVLEDGRNGRLLRLTPN